MVWGAARYLRNSPSGRRHPEHSKGSRIGRGRFFTPLRGVQVDMIEFPDGKRMILLSEGRLLNLGNATGHPSFVMSASFTNQVLAQIELYQNNADGKYKNDVYVLPKHLDEKVANLHLAKLGATLTTLSAEQAAYIGVEVAGPYKPDTYRY